MNNMLYGTLLTSEGTWANPQKIASNVQIFSTFMGVPNSGGSDITINYIDTDNILYQAVIPENSIEKNYKEIFSTIEFHLIDTEVVLYSNFYDETAIYFTDGSLTVNYGPDFQNKTYNYSNLSIRNFVFGEYRYRT